MANTVMVQPYNLTIRCRGSINKYPAKSHARRVADQLGVDHGLIILEAATSKNWPDSDMPVPFRQDRYFYYLTGCNEPGCYVTYNIATDQLVLWLPPIDKDRIVWTGRGSTVEEALEKYDVDEAKYIKAKPKVNFTQAKRLRKHAGIAKTVWNCRIEGRGTVYSFKSCMKGDLVKHWAVEGAGKKLKHAMNACRVIKDEFEIDLIRTANDISAKAHKSVLTNLHKFTNEADVEAEYTGVCIASHAKEQAYSPICGAGPNAGVLHYTANNAPFTSDTQLMVLDAGCEVSCYASDVTRTFPLNRHMPGHWPSKEAENIYAVVEAMQEACIAKIRPGQAFIELQQLAQRIAVRGLLDLGLLRAGTEDEILEAGTISAFFPHGLGHHVGLEVHDVSPAPHPPTSAERSKPSNVSHLPLLPPFDFAATSSASLYSDASALEENMVVTVEPGIYFNAFLVENFFLNNDKHAKYIDGGALKHYMPVGGVRIEDDILVTKDGYENLTTAPKGKEMLDVIREGAMKR